MGRNATHRLIIEVFIFGERHRSFLPHTSPHSLRAAWCRQPRALDKKDALSTENSVDPTRVKANSTGIRVILTDQSSTK